MMAVDLERMRTYDFTFRAVDEGGAYCRYDAILAYDAPDGHCYLVYADEKPDDRGEIATYGSFLLDPASADAAQDAVDSGCTPKKPPLLELAPFEEDVQWRLVEELIDAVEELGEED